MKDLLAHLVGARNADGGWGAAPEMPTDTESTALAVLALGASGETSSDDAVRAGLAFLRSTQRADGAWPLSGAVPEPSWATSLCILALAPFDAHREAAVRAAGWLVVQEGRRPAWLARTLWRLIGGDKVALDYGIRGWSWNANSFPWVEPTAYALIALKKLRARLASAAAARIQEGERLLLDRMCDAGGWNYGNARVLGDPLAPYPETTSVALLALRDRQDDVRLRKSAEVLERLLDATPSGLALGLGILALAAYGRRTMRFERQLRNLYSRTRFLGQTSSLAAAALALAGGHERLTP
ncbi:MAG TPA: prenyltransferase/squalene oxidase repeat-containing protein [Candidatus Tectomicrobia bacterium]|nr:prenyltransferase/squalene oxidase repeat-containing protein [Candidatus Tectomicrobia bacterium]